MSHSNKPFFGYSIPFTTGAAAGPANGRVAPAVINTVRLTSNQDCWVAIGRSPTAVKSPVGAFVSGVAPSMLIRASTAGERFTLAEGESISVIGDTASGTLSVCEMI